MVTFKLDSEWLGENSLAKTGRESWQTKWKVTERAIKLECVWYVLLPHRVERQMYLKVRGIIYQREKGMAEFRSCRTFEKGDGCDFHQASGIV